MGFMRPILVQTIKQGESMSCSWRPLPRHTATTIYRPRQWYGYGRFSLIEI